MMKIRSIRHLLVAGTMVPALAVGGAAFAQTVPIDQLTTNQGLSIEGEVRDVFGNRFVLEDPTGRVLVETGPSRGREYDLREGERLTVFGEPDSDGGFEAFRIVREDGSEIELPRPSDLVERNGDGGNDVRGTIAGDRPDDSDVELIAILETAGFTDIRFDERKGRHVEYEARDSAGQRVEIEIFFDGEVKKIEFEDDGSAALDQVRSLMPAVVLQAAAERDLLEVEKFETKGRHYEIEGYDAAGRETEIEVDFDGRIRKVEIDDDDERRVEAPRIGEEELRGRVEEAGYRFEGSIEQRPRHFEVAAVNPEGEPVELHVDFDGEIYKEQLRR
jgi:hypothetical protein